MALTRITTWTAGQVLTASALNAEFDNILSNPIVLFSPTTGNIDSNYNQITHLVLEKLGADPAAGHQGRLFYNTASNQVKYDDGSTITAVAGSAAAAYPAAGSYVRGLQGSLSTNLGVFSATRYLMQPTNGVASFLVQSTATLTINTRTAGPAANGRDQAGVFNSTDVHWYAISTGALSTSPAGLVSSQPPEVGPTLPTSYSAWAYLGASKYSTGTSGVTATHLQRGAHMFYAAPVATTAILTTAATSITAASVAAGVPVNSISADILVKPGGLPTASNQVDLTYGVGVSGVLMYQSLMNVTGVSTGSVDGIATIVALPNVSQSISYQAVSAIGGSDAYITLGITGYTNANGDAG